MMKDYFEILLDTFKSTTQQLVELPKPMPSSDGYSQTTLVSMARAINEFATYDFGIFSEPADAAANAAYKMAFLKKTPLLFAHEVVFRGYEYTAHLSLSEPRSWSLHSRLKPPQASLARRTEAISQRASKRFQTRTCRRRNQCAPQYTLTPNAVSVIQRSLSSSARISAPNVSTF